jgi:transcriptional regulator with XRE-family HTH domain
MLFTLAFAAWLKEERGRSGRSLRDLGKQLGVSHTTVSKWEKGQLVPGEDHLRLIAEAYDADFTKVRLRAIVQEGRLDVTGLSEEDVAVLIRCRDAARATDE